MAFCIKHGSSFVYTNRQDVLASIRNTCNDILKFNEQLLNVINGMPTKPPDVVVGKLGVHISSLNIKLADLKYKMNYLEQLVIDVGKTAGLPNMRPRTVSKESADGNEEASHKENDLDSCDLTSYNICNLICDLDSAVITNVGNVELQETIEKSRRAKRRSRSLSIIRKVIRRFSRSRAPSPRFLSSDDIDLDVTLREHI